MNNTEQQERHAAVIGGGIMGCDIAAIFAAGGWTVHVMSPSQKTREGLPTRLRKTLAELGADEKLAERVRAYDTLEALPWAQVEIAIESVTENLELKRQIFTQMEALARPDTPLATNTSSFPIGEVGGHLGSRHRVLGVHFFMPAHLVPLVEVIRGDATDAELAEQVMATMASLGKVPILVGKDIPGFVANRLQHALVREALAMVAQGVVSPQDVDKAVRYGFGFRFLACGPMMQKEMSGWDTNYLSGSIIYPTLCNDNRPPQMFKDMVERGHTGMKAGQGLWAWDADAIAREKARYGQTLREGFQLLMRDSKAS